MSDPTLILRHYHDDCASNTLSLATHINGMEANSNANLYSDIRSLSRGKRQHLRKRQPILNPICRTKHCHRDCLSHAHRAISSRRRRQRGPRAECTEEAYWDRECAELEHRERTEYSDLVTLFYNHGHNTEVIASLRPRLSDNLDENEDAEEWLHVSDDRNKNLEAKVVTTRNWTIYLYPPPPSPTPSSPSLDTIISTSHHFPPATNHAWDGTTFTYHRNPTGLWELGYASSETTCSNAPDPYGCAHTPLPLDCACCSASCGFFACACSSFPAWWQSPQEGWRGSVVEWMSGEAYDGMCFADALHDVVREFERTSRVVGVGEYSRGGREKLETGGCDEWTFVRPPPSADQGPEEWDVLSSLSSTGSWRIVDVT